MGFRVILVALLFFVSRTDEIPFEKHSIDLGASKAVAVADLNGDGNWYEAPRWTKHKFRTLGFQDNYVDDFSDMVLDINGDGHLDIVTGAYFARKLYWHRRRVADPGGGH